MLPLLAVIRALRGLTPELSAPYPPGAALALRLKRGMAEDGLPLALIASGV